MDSTAKDFTSVIPTPAAPVDVVKALQCKAQDTWHKVKVVPLFMSSSSLGLKQAELAQKLNVKPSVINDYEPGTAAHFFYHSSNYY